MYMSAESFIFALFLLSDKRDQSFIQKYFH